MNEQETMAALAAQGAQALSGLNPQSDIHHGATWFQGTVPADGGTAYLYLGKLGETGASTLRFVVRYEGEKSADLGLCTVVVDGVELGSFSPALNRCDQPSDGSVRQIADIHFDEIRPIVLSMLNGQSAVIRTGNGAEIPLERAELDEMRRVLSAYLHMQSQSGALGMRMYQDVLIAISESETAIHLKVSPAAVTPASDLPRVEIAPDV